jgi:enoyl-CoA hydratase/carnithine racemase
VIPGLGGTQLLPRRIGVARAAELIYTAPPPGRRGGRARSAWSTASSRRGEAAATATTSPRRSPGTPRSPSATPSGAIRLGTGVDLAAALEIEDGAWRAAAFSADRAEGVRAFTEKRAPRWPGLP